MQYKLKTCFRCLDKVHQFEDNKFGCDNCKTVWEFKKGAWYVVKEETKENDIRRNKQER